ncbi:MAG: hypothetical protein J3Q66DRAFT_337808 [Benniella sp.]|nr:MAG: hypothetical protein J3Q66DRAFT_337808 [Benniella sp.]
MTSDPVSFLYPCRSALVLVPFLLLKGRLQINTYGSFNDKFLFQLPDGDHPCILRFHPYDRSRISNEVVVSKGSMLASHPTCGLTNRADKPFSGFSSRLSGERRG